MSNKKTIAIIILLLVGIFLIVFGIMRFVELKKVQKINEEVKGETYHWNSSFPIRPWGRWGNS